MDLTLLWVLALALRDRNYSETPKTAAEHFIFVIAERVCPVLFGQVAYNFYAILNPS